MLSGAKACKSCRSRQELSNSNEYLVFTCIYYLLAKFGFDTAVPPGADAARFRESRQHFLMKPRGLNCRICGGAHRPRGAHSCNSASYVSYFINLFVPLRYLQFLRIVRFTSQPAENEHLKVCQKIAKS